MWQARSSPCGWSPWSRWPCNSSWTWVPTSVAASSAASRWSRLWGRACWSGCPPWRRSSCTWSWWYACDAPHGARTSRRLPAPRTTSLRRQTCAAAWCSSCFGYRSAWPSASIPSSRSAPACYTISPGSPWPSPASTICSTAWPTVTFAALTSSSSITAAARRWASPGGRAATCVSGYTSSTRTRVRHPPVRSGTGPTDAKYTSCKGQRDPRTRAHRAQSIRRRDVPDEEVLVVSVSDTRYATAVLARSSNRRVYARITSHRRVRLRCGFTGNIDRLVSSLATRRSPVPNIFNVGREASLILTHLTRGPSDNISFGKKWRYCHCRVSEVR